MHKFISLTIACTISLCSLAQNVGIFTTTPLYPLTVVAQNNKGITQKNGTVEMGFYTSLTSAYLQTWSNHNLQFATNNSPAQMTLTTAGNLGIGVSAPTARLDVNGTVRIRGGNPSVGDVLTATDANGNAEWKPSPAAATKILYISHPAFLPDRSSNGWSTVYPGTGRRPTNPGAGLYKFQAPLLLPVGAVIKEITWYFEDWNEAQNMTFTLVREVNGSPENVSQVASTGSVSGAGTRTLAVPLNYVVNSEFHWLEVSIQDWPLNYTLLIHGARITYEL
ncbi:MAG: hypothetical protein V4717_15310 [Bacteroidota bacterium]